MKRTVVTLLILVLLFSECKKDENQLPKSIKESSLTFTPTEGLYETELEIEIQIIGISDAIIYYTMGEDNPSINSIKYTAPIKLTRSAAIKAIAVKGDETSKVFTANYTITPKINFDYFPYTTGSVWEFSIEQRSGTSGANSNITTETGFMKMQVTNFDPATFIATLECTHVGAAKTILPSTFYLRKTSEGIEYSAGGLLWNEFLNLNLERSNDTKFFVANSPGKPGSLLGNLQSGVSSSNVTCNVGSFTALETSKEYMPSSYDNYMYTDDAFEYFNPQVGFIYSIYNSYDGSDYPAFVYKRTVSLNAYKIIKADGSLLSAGSLLSENPIAPYVPTNLLCKWTSTSAITISWEDNSLNETGFVIEKRNVSDNTSFAILVTTNNDVKSYVDNDVISDKAYEYKIKATNSYGNSNYTDVFFVNKYGIPRAPTGLQAQYKIVDVMEGLRWVKHYWVDLSWEDNSDNEAGFQISMKEGVEGTWTDLGFVTAANKKTETLINGYYLPWPSNNYSFRIRATGSYGDSEVSNIAIISTK